MQTRELVIQILFVLAGLAALGLVVWGVISWILQARQARLLRRIAFSGHPIISFVSTERALEVARERRSKIVSFLEGREFRGVVSRRFQESPSPDVRAPNEGFGENSMAAAVHTAHLRWQLNEDRLLLMERLMDAISSFQRSHPKDPDLLVTAVLVARQDNRRPDMYPWRAVLHTEGTGALVSYLSELGDWLGIGIDVAPPLPSVPLGSCVGRGSSEGQVGGLLRSATATISEYAVTCHHVLSERCGSLYWPQPPNRPEYSDYSVGAVDAALIGSASCFIRSSPNRHAIACASSADRESFASAKIPVTKSPALNRRQGLILHVVHAVPGENGKQIRAPHLLIVPIYSKRFGLIWPLFDRAFSVPGHSGAWVTDAPASLWFGMVVQGSQPPLTISYALEASFLIDVFNNALPDETPLIPYRIN
jgi:hypothetical protein